MFLAKTNHFIIIIVSLTDQMVDWFIIVMTISRSVLQISMCSSLLNKIGVIQKTKKPIKPRKSEKQNNQKN